MKNYTILFCLFLSSVYSCTENSKQTEKKEGVTKMETTVSDTENAINQVVTAAYKVITFEKGTTPDYMAMKALFTPKATLYNFRDDSLKFYFIDDFIAEFKAGNFAGELKAFDEVELGGETEFFGKIGHRISAYASKFNGADEIGERGVNSFQVVNVNEKWLINSIIWDIEKEGQVIPEGFFDIKSH